MWLLNKFLKINLKRNFSSKVPTIFALSSGQGKCGVAVIRISGPKASEAILKMTKAAELPKPRMASLHCIRDPVTSEELDRGLILWFPGPKSFTGEDSCEFQVHGGPAVIMSILSGLSKIPDFRPAEAGDFTKRAFMAGKLDLTEVEGLADLIHAETELQRKQALYQMEGNLSLLYNKWREVLKRVGGTVNKIEGFGQHLHFQTKLGNLMLERNLKNKKINNENLAHVEAYIDFSEDENIEDNVLSSASEDLMSLKKEMESHLSDGRKGERLRDGIKTTIIGEPNAGKSSLLNAICQRPAAIVTSIPGTTRDTIEKHLNINGFPVTLTDTAGLRTDTSDVVEKEGILRAHQCIDNSDLVLLIIDSTKLFQYSPTISQDEFVGFLKSHLQCLNLKAEHVCNCFDDIHCLPKFIFVLNKIDLITLDQKNALRKIREKNKNVNYISCKSEENFKCFLNDITEVFHSLCANPSKESPSITQSRHRHHLNKSVEHLNEYFTFVNKDSIISAQKLRLSLRHLGKITGIVSSEEILDVIFKDFCIGK